MGYLGLYMVYIENKSGIYWVCMVCVLGVGALDKSIIRLH